MEWLSVFVLLVACLGSAQSKAHDPAFSGGSWFNLREENVKLQLIYKNQNVEHSIAILRLVVLIYGDNASSRGTNWSVTHSGSKENQFYTLPFGQALANIF